MPEGDDKLKEFLKKFKDRRNSNKKSVQLRFTRSLNVLKPSEKISNKKEVKKEKFKKL